MFEFEQCERTISARLSHPAVDSKVLSEFGPERIRSYSVLSWGEHCTECVFPSCYQTCSFYQPRADGRCRRFTFGISRTKALKSWMPYSACIEFKNWSKLFTQGNATQLPIALSSLLSLAGTLAWTVSTPLDRMLQKITGRRRISLVLQSLRRRIIRRLGKAYGYFSKPDCLLLEIYNPMAVEAQLHLCVLGSKNGQPGRYEWKERAGLGFSSFAVPVSILERAIDLGQTFEMSMSVAEEQGKRLYFCSATFVRLVKKPASVNAESSKKIKCVVWDLDQTLWDGILVEGPAGGLQLKPGIASLLKELDRRGILLSIASKNSEEDARKALENLGVWDFFLAPTINWQPKSVSIQQIAKKLNLGLDSFAFIDDMPFERDEVSSVLPMVKIIPAEQCISILERPEFAGDVSAEGSSRRLMYRTEMRREEAQGASSLTYDAFLATCEIRVRIERPGDDLVSRIQDIVQRTNQLNITTQRYDLEQTRALIHSADCHCYIISCSDKYGDYGYVGFICIGLENQGIVIKDCMFSCRIQGKRIDEAVLSRVINYYIGNGVASVRARFVPTKRNAPAGEMLKRVGFRPKPGLEGFLTLGSTSPCPEVEYVRIQGELAFASPVLVGQN